MVSRFTVRKVHGKSDLDLFLDVQKTCFADDDVWVPPLKFLIRNQLNPKKNPWFLHGEAALFIALCGGKAVGRISAQVDSSHQNLHNDNAGFFGFFDCINDQEIANELFHIAGIWLKSRGMELIRGPFSLNINQESGLLINGFESPPRMMMGHAKPYYQELVERAGFLRAKDLFAYLTPMDTAIPYKYLKILNRSIENNTDFYLRHLEPKKYERDIKIIVSLFNSAWSENWGFIPMTEDDARHLASELKSILLPELVWLVFYKGEPAAMALALPDLNEIIADLDGKLLPTGWFKLLWRTYNRRSWSSRTRIPLMGVAPRFKNKKMGSILALLVIDAIRRESMKLNLPICEMSWVLENNRATQHSVESVGGRVYKTYRIYEKKLE